MTDKETAEESINKIWDFFIKIQESCGQFTLEQAKEKKYRDTRSLRPEQPKAKS